MSRICMNNCSGIDNLPIPVMDSEKWAYRRRRNGRFCCLYPGEKMAKEHHGCFEDTFDLRVLLQLERCSFLSPFDPLTLWRCPPLVSVSKSAVF